MPATSLRRSAACRSRISERAADPPAAPGTVPVNDTARDPDDGTLRTIFEALPDPVLVTDPRSRVLFENRRARELFTLGGDEDETRRHRVEVNNLLFTSLLARPVADEGGARELVLMDPGSGEELVFEFAPAPLRAGATVSLLRDVTELRRTYTRLGHEARRAASAEAGAAEERDRLSLVLAGAGAPIIVTDGAGHVLLLNREAQRLLGGPGPATDAERANAERFFAGLEAVTAGGAQSGTTRVELADPEDGRACPAELIAGVARDGDGEARTIVSVLRDLTQQEENARLAAALADANRGLEHAVERATAELRERNHRLELQGRELERAYRHKSEFLASMSHELRTPINAMLGYISLLRDRIYGELSESQDGALARIESASSHLLELINDVLDLAKIEAGRMSIVPEPVALPRLLRHAVESVEPLARARGLEIILDAPESLPALVSDPTRVRQVLLNLLSNAVKFTRTGGISVVARAVDGDGVEVAVADTGIGLSPAALEVIFDDFRQVDQSSTREFQGTGLGLSIVRKLMGLLGGSVRVESTPGTGSVFTVTLPLEAPVLPEGEASIRRVLAAEAVIVRDDEEIVVTGEPPDDEG
jgi:signal transduction histidine kinase